MIGFDDSAVAHWVVDSVVTQSRMKRKHAENLMRSAKAPTIRAGVIIANVIWNTKYDSSGITTPLENVAAVELASTPCRKSSTRPLSFTRSSMTC